MGIFMQKLTVYPVQCTVINQKLSFPDRNIGIVKMSQLLCHYDTKLVTKFKYAHVRIEFPAVYSLQHAFTFVVASSNSFSHGVHQFMSAGSPEAVPPQHTVHHTNFVRHCSLCPVSYIDLNAFSLSWQWNNPSYCSNGFLCQSQTRYSIISASVDQFILSRTWSCTSLISNSHWTFSIETNRLRIWSIKRNFLQTCW